MGRRARGAGLIYHRRPFGGGTNININTNMATKSLARFLKTANGLRAVACFVGVRSTDPTLRMAARIDASHFCPRVRNWTMSDLIEAALVILPSGTYAAR